MSRPARSNQRDGVLRLSCRMDISRRYHRPWDGAFSCEIHSFVSGVRAVTADICRNEGWLD